VTSEGFRHELESQTGPRPRSVDYTDPHMKRKNLSKKIRRLEARLQKDAKKLAKLKRKLRAAATAGMAQEKRKSVARTTEARKLVKSPGPTEKIARTQPAAVKSPSAAENSTSHRNAVRNSRRR